MRLHLRIDDRNLTHTHFTVFIDGGNCGNLTLMNDEWTQLVHWLSLGKRENELVVSGQNQADWNWRPWNVEHELDESEP